MDDRDHTVTKLSPGLYRAAIDEGHKHGLRVIAHIYTLADAKGVLKAGVDAFAHSVRDMDVDDAYIKLMKASRALSSTRTSPTGESAWTGAGSATA